MKSEVLRDDMWRENTDTGENICGDQNGFTESLG
jgi:hypothetical protein